MSQQLPESENQQAINLAQYSGDYVGGDEIRVGNIKNSQVVAIGREALAAQGNVIVYKGEAYFRLNYRSEISDSVNFYTDTFVGRRAEIPQLIEFSAQESPGYLLVEALAGFGKSALMYQLLYLQETGSWESHSKPYLLYFFIRKDGNRNRPVSFLQALNSQLLEILNLPGGVPNELSALRNQFSELWSKAGLLANREQPLLLLVDGLDEAVEEDKTTIANLLPSPTSYTHVIVTSRPNPQPLQLVSLEHPLKKAKVLSLQKFDECDIKALLQKYKASAEIVANLSLRILEITKGEPLFARFVCEDVVTKGESALSQLEENPPTNVEDYFRQQFNQLRSLANDEGEEIAWDILGLLVVTLGGITIEEMAEVLKEKKHKVHKAVELIQRFLLGDSQLTLMHLQLRKVLTEDFNHREQVENRQKLLDFCANWQRHHSSYALTYYAQHLVEAGRSQGLHDLLAQETSNRRNAWYEAKEKIGDAAGFVADVSLAWAQAEKEFEQDPGVTIGRQCRYALIIVSLNSLSANLPVELLLALIQKNVWTPSQGLAYVLQSSNPQQKANLLTELADHLPPNLKELGLLKALAAAREIQSEEYRALALSRLAPILPPELLPKVLAAAREIQSEEYRVKALSSLAPILPPELLPKVLAAAREIQSEEYRALALSSLAPILPPNLLPEALAAAREIQSEEYRAYALSSLAAKLPELLPEALAAARKIQSDIGRAYALNSLAPILPPNLLPEALAATREIQSDIDRAYALSHLAPILPELLPEALAAARKIQSEIGRVGVLSHLAPILPELLPEALAAARKIQSEIGRVGVLSRLAPILPPNLLPEALAAARKIQSDIGRAGVLSSLAPILPPNLLPEALAAAREIQSDMGRAGVLSSLAPILPPNLLPEALAAAREIQSEEDRAKALSSLVAKLPELLPEALAAARKIQDDIDRALALSSLADKLPELLPEALAAAREIQSEEDRALALSSLADKLPELLPEALAAARKIQDEEARAYTLSLLAEKLPELLPEALAATREIQSEEDRAQALSSLAAKLPPNLLPEALAATREIQSEEDRAKALSSLAAKLPELLPEALAAAREIQSEEDRAKALSSLASILPPNLLPEALAATREIQSEEDRAKALSSLAAKLPELLPEALAATREIQSEEDRAKALSSLASILPPNLLPEALAAAREIQSEEDRAKALSSLVAKLPELLPEALAAAREIQSEYSRADALSSLADKLSQIQKTRLFRLWRDTLHILSVHTRPHLLSDLSALTPVIFTLGGKLAVKDIATAIQDVSRWWR